MAMSNISEEIGLSQLLPYFSNFIEDEVSVPCLYFQNSLIAHLFVEQKYCLFVCFFVDHQVKHNTRNLPLLYKLVTFARALLDNPNFNLEPYVCELSLIFPFEY
jgi:hypothetical protein